MEMSIRLQGNKKVSAEFGGFAVSTDQPKSEGGEGTAPSPFELFLASLGTCAGFFVLSFCQKRGLPTEGIELLQTSDWDSAKHLASKVTLEIRVPPSFPEKYRESLVHAANLCTVKRHLHEPPKFELVTRVG